MPRQAREISKTGIYHVIFRGVNQKTIFHDDEDHQRFLSTIARFKYGGSFDVLGWCLMKNHAHLLLHEKVEDLSVSLKRCGISYVRYFNAKYATTGHLFQDRYRSEPVEDEKYLLTVIRYIHRNPVKAGLVNLSQDWEWSSAGDYFGLNSIPNDMLNYRTILSLFSENIAEAQKKFHIFNETFSDDECLENLDVLRLSENEARTQISATLENVNIDSIKNMPKLQRDLIIKKVKSINGITQRQIANIFGISQTLVSSL